MPYYRLTFNPHVSESDLLEKYLILLEPFLERFAKYSWSVEKDSTINKHIELIIYNEDPDPKCNFSKKFKTFTFKKFFDSLKNKQTDPKVFMKCTKVSDTPEDLQFCLGYVNKEHTIRRNQKGFSENEISTAVEYYFLSKHLDKSYLKEGWTLITTKNIHSIVEQYCEDNGYLVDDPLLKLKMTRDKFSFVNVSPNNVSRTFRELKIAHGVSDKHDERIMNTETMGYDNNYDSHMQNDIDDIIEFLKTSQSLDREEIPKNIANIFKKHLQIL